MGDDAVQHVHGHQLLPVIVVADHAAPGNPHPRLLFLIRRNLVGHPAASAVHRRLLRREVNRLGPSKILQVLVLQDAQHFVDIQISVQADVGVGRCVEFPVGVDKILVGQIRNVLRIAAGIESVRRIRQHRQAHGILQQLVRIGHGSLHFVEHHALVRRRPRFIEGVMPALLPENIRVPVDGRMQHRIHVHPHQIDEILVVLAGHRV